MSQMKGYFDELIAAGYLIQGVPDAWPLKLGEWSIGDMLWL